MTTEVRNFALALVGLTLSMASPFAAAQDIVIDSGTAETVISRLPAAPAQEEPVCSDSADGTLGSCANLGAQLNFYETEEIFLSVPQGSRVGFDTAACEPGDIMMGPVSMTVVRFGGEDVSVFSWSFQRTDSESLRFSVNLNETCMAEFGCTVGGPQVGLCLDATP